MAIIQWAFKISGFAVELFWNKKKITYKFLETLDGSEKHIFIQRLAAKSKQKLSQIT